MEKEMDNRVYYAIRNLPSYLGKSNFSEAFITFINDLVSAFAECEEIKEKCVNLRSQIHSSETWH